MRTTNLMNNSEKFRFNLKQNLFVLKRSQRNFKATQNLHVLNEMVIQLVQSAKLSMKMANISQVSFRM